MNKKWLFVFFLLVVMIFAFVFVMLLAAKSRELAKENQRYEKSDTIVISSDSVDITTDTVAVILPNESYYPYYHRKTIHSPFGYPADADTTDDFILEKNQFVVSYCKKKNVANWVAWQLNATWVGTNDRYKGQFISDTALPADFYRVKHSDYTNSKYDRGHLVRSKERTAGSEDNKATFLLTNIIPQTPDLNQGVWLRVEDYYLNKAMKENRNMYIVSGGIYKSSATLHDKGLVAIPDSCFKIVLLTEQKNIHDKISINDFEVIAVSMPNIQGIRNHSWQQYITTIDAIEASTGYDFFMLLPDSIENVLESDF